MSQTKYASAVSKNLGLGLDLQPFSKDDFLSRHPWSVLVLQVYLISTQSTKTPTNNETLKAHLFYFDYPYIHYYVK